MAPGAPSRPISAAVAAAYPHVRGYELRAAFKRRDVRLNGRRALEDALVSAGDVIKIYGVSDGAPGGFTPGIVYEDDNIILVVKPQGMPVEADKHGGASLMGALPASHRPVYACHRLDVQTGGLTLLAKNTPARDCALEAFARATESGVKYKRHEGITKIYHCQTVGTPAPPAGEMAGYLLKDAAKARVAVLDKPVPGARLARTLYRTLSAGDIAVVECEPLTGRTHQIRAQLARAGCPVLGDDKYGDRPANKLHGVRVQRLWSVGVKFMAGGALGYLDGREFRIAAPFDKSE